MPYSQTLASLFPNGPLDPTAPVFSGLLAAIGVQLDAQSADGDTLVNNFSPYTADNNGIVLWEQAFELPSDPSLSLAQRQQRAAAKAFRLNGAFTAQKYVNLFNLFSPSKSATFYASPPNYTVYGTFLIDDMQYYNDALRYILSAIPAHIAFSPIFQTTSTSQVTSSRGVILVVSRDVFGNGQNVGVLDGSWNLDGSGLLNSMAKPGPTTSSTISVSINRPVMLADHPQTQGFVLDGGRKLDGSWVLSGAVTVDQVIGIQKSFVFSRTIPKTSGISSAVAVAVSRHAVINNSNVLDGSWALDGSRTLNGKLYAITVTVNGAAV